MRFETVIKNGIVVDGTGNPWVRADVGIANGKIVKTGRIGQNQADETVDANGLIVSPGFIDVHDHSDFTILAAPTAESKITQGVTTIVIGNCGESAAPLLGGAMENAKTILKEWGLSLNWLTLSEYIRVVEEKEPAVNIATLVGHGTLRASVMGYEVRAPTKGELDEMKTLLSTAMNEGAFGLSTGLEYMPGKSAETQEIVELCKVLPQFSGIYVTHMRNRDNRVVEATREAIEIGEKSGVPTHLSHLASRFPAEGMSREYLRLVDEARARGVDVTCDSVIPSAKEGYHWGSSGLAIQVIPPWGYEGGAAKTLERMKDPAIRERFRKEVEPQWKLFSAGKWDRLKVQHSVKHPEFFDKTIAEISKLMRVDPWEACYQLLLDEGTLNIPILGATIAEKDMLEVIKHPTASLEADRRTVSSQGPTSGRGVDPNAYGAFTRFLKRYVREQRIFSVEATIMKMAGVAACRLGLGDRGLLREGMWADITVFDLSRVADQATFEKPAQFSIGVEYVFVNGKKVLEHGRPTGVRPGKFLAKSL